MARIRSIKPEITQSESLGSVSREARLCFVLLWTVADDFGRLRAAPRLLASTLFPYDEDAPKLIEGWLDELERIGCVRRYEIDGNRYIDIPKWSTHQRIDHPAASKLPEYKENSKPIRASSRNPRRASRGLTRTSETVAKSSESLAPDLGSGSRKGEDRIGLDQERPAALPPECAKSGFDDFWDRYPRKVGKGAAKTAWSAAIRKVEPEVIAAALPRFLASINGTEPRFIPHAATWLNQERWADEPVRGPPSQTEILNAMRDAAEREETEVIHEQARIS